MRFTRIFQNIILLCLGVVACALVDVVTLDNGLVAARFNAQGLSSLTDHETNSSFRVEDGWEVKLDLGVLNPGNCSSAQQNPGIAQQNANKFEVSWLCHGQHQVVVTYGLEPRQRFVSKKMRISSSASKFFLEEISVWRTNVTSLDSSASPAWLPVTTPSHWMAVANIAGFARWPSVSVYLSVSNPFNLLVPQTSSAPSSVSVWGHYAPQLEHNASFPESYHEADAGVLGFATRGKYNSGNGVNIGEATAFKACAESFYLDAGMRQNRTVKVHVAWDESDYQIDIATSAGRDEYKRIIERSAQLGIEGIVYEPRNSAHSSRLNATDGWGWEAGLWFSMGERLRNGSWNPQRDAVPQDIIDMVQYARSVGVRLMAYVYPCLPMEEMKAHWVGDPSHGANVLDLSQPLAATWLLETLSAFMQKTGAGGFSWDYDVFTGLAPLAYAQWRGWMWVLKGLRLRFPDILMDHRQSNHLYGPWYQMAGSYAEPLAGDENPETYGVQIPSLHSDHVSADQLRIVNLHYASAQLLPSSRIPGFMFHQTERSNAKGDVVCQGEGLSKECYDLNTRDFDYMGYKYSVLSSIATAGLNNVITFIPARDEAEFKAVPKEDIDFIQGWLRWTDEHMSFLRNAAPIPVLSGPHIGNVDGWHAMSDNEGFVFLFNPNFKPVQVQLPLDEALGISNTSNGSAWVMVEVYPNKGARARGPWLAGELISVEVGGSDAFVFQIQKHAPLAGADASPAFAAIGTGETGATVRIPSTAKEIREGSIKCAGLKEGTSEVLVTFAGDRVHHAMPISKHQVPDHFSGGWFNTTFVIPSAIQAQLDARAKKLGINWTKQEEAATWLIPSRLLMTIFYNVPSVAEAPRLWIDGKEVNVQKAFNSRDAPPSGNTFLGYFYDASELAVDSPHHTALLMPRMVIPVDPAPVSGIDYPGHDMDACTHNGCKFPGNTSHIVCSELCAKTLGCMAWSWDPHGCDRYNKETFNKCYIKDSAYTTKSAAACRQSQVISDEAMLDRFQGLFWENVETEYTTEVASCRAVTRTPVDASEAQTEIWL